MLDRIPHRWPLWLLATLAYPVAGLVGYAVGGPVTSATGVLAALAAGAVIGAGQALAIGSRDLPSVAMWVGATAVGLAIGTVVGATLALPLALTGLLAGALIGAGQALAARVAGVAVVGWVVVTALAWATGWTVTTSIGVDPNAGWANFGVSGAIVAQAITLAGALVLTRRAAAASA